MKQENKSFIDDEGLEIKYFRQILTQEEMEKSDKKSELITYITYFKDGKMVAGFDACNNPTDWIKVMQKVSKYQMPTYLPQNISDVRSHLEEVYNMNVNMYKIKKSLDQLINVGALSVNNPEIEKIQKYMDGCESYAKEVLDSWADLSPLWMGHDYKGMHYGGGNPYNMYPDSQYGVYMMEEAFDYVYPYRKNILRIADGANKFTIEDVVLGSIGQHGINHIEDKIKKGQLIEMKKINKPNKAMK